MPVEKVTRFIEINQNIQTLSLWSKSRNTINELLGHDLCINELFFDVPCKGFVDVSDDLFSLCTQQSAPIRLHLKFDDLVKWPLIWNLGKLVPLAPFIEGLYFRNRPVDGALAKEILQFENLKKIQLAVKNQDEVGWLAQLKSLEELYIYDALSELNWNKYHAMMLMLVGNVRSLKKIYIHNNSRMFSQFGLDELDLERRKLKNAQKIMIFVKTEESTSIGRLHSVRCDYEKIEAKRVEAETLNNPLVTQYLTSFPFSRFIQYLLPMPGIQYTDTSDDDGH